MCQSLGSNGKEATVHDLELLMEGEALSFSAQPHHKTEQTDGQISRHPPASASGSPGGSESRLVTRRERHLQKEALTPRAQAPETAFSQQNLPTQRSFQPDLLFLCQQPRGRQPSARTGASLPLLGSGQRSSKHLGERTELAVWDVPAVPTLQRPVEGLKK